MTETYNFHIEMEPAPMDIFTRADIVIATHAVQATSYTKARVKQLWRLIIGDRDTIDEIDVSQPSAVYVSGRRRFWLEVHRQESGSAEIRLGCFNHDGFDSAGIRFNSFANLVGLTNRKDLDPRVVKLMEALDIESLTYPNGRVTPKEKTP